MKKPNNNPRFAEAITAETTRAERKELGKLSRKNATLKSHKHLSIAKTGRDVIAVLEESNIGRIKELVPIRYARMLSSPFTFFRGSAGLMALDLAPSPNSGIIVQACGDCHIQNFGVFATPERKFVVDINDFDETLPAPWEWDVKRLAASLVLAAADNGFNTDIGKNAAWLMARAYREQINELSRMTLLEVWYSHVEYEKAAKASSRETQKRSRKLLEDALSKSSPETLSTKFTEKKNGKLRFKNIPPLLSRLSDSLGQNEREAFKAYRSTLADDRQVILDRFQLVDVARKVVGIGSVGTMCGVILLVSSDSDVLILQVKEARKSVLEPYAGQSRYKHHGQRVVNGQKLMQAASDIFLGWTTGLRAPHRHLFVRQLRDVKIGVNTALWSKDDYKTLPVLAGQILARAHARSSDASILRGYLGTDDAFEEALSEFAVSYAKQTEIDYDRFAKACKSGRLKVRQAD
jgi:uncharacterized protein (DUF2252 family)